MLTYNTFAFAYITMSMVIFLLTMQYYHSLITALEFTAKVLVTMVIILMLLCLILGIMTTVICFARGYSLFDILQNIRRETAQFHVQFNV